MWLQIRRWSARRETMVGVSAESLGHVHTDALAGKIGGLCAGIVDADVAFESSQFAWPPTRPAIRFCHSRVFLLQVPAAFRDHQIG